MLLWEDCHSEINPRCKVNGLVLEEKPVDISHVAFLRQNYPMRYLWILRETERIAVHPAAGN